MKRAHRRFLPAVAVFAWSAAMLCAAAAPASDTAAAKHFLWKAQGPSNAVYFLGSIHLLKKDIYPLPEPVEQAYRSADAVAFETDLDAMNDPQVQLKLLASGKCVEGETLRDYLSPDTYAQFKASVAALFGAGEALDSFKPWLAAVTVMLAELQKQGFDPAEGVDRHYFSRARRDGKKIVALEAPEHVTGVLAALSKPDQEAMIKETLQETVTLKAEMKAIVEAWKTGDTKTIERTMVDCVRQYPQVYQHLLVDRNRHWLPEIEGLLRGGKTAFVVVGAAHMVGKDSLLEMLRGKGCKIEQL